MYWLFVASIIELIFLIVFYLDYETPYSKKIRDRYRVKDNSILRKIIKFKDRGTTPCTYWKIVPLYVYISINILTGLLGLIDICINSIISIYLGEIFMLIAFMIILAVPFIYVAIVQTWWYIVEIKEIKHSNDHEDEI